MSARPGPSVWLTPIWPKGIELPLPYVINDSAISKRLRRDKLSNGTLAASDVREFGEDGGLRGTEGVRRSNSVVGDARGRIWLSTNLGVSVADPSHVVDDAVPALAHIKSISADGVLIGMESPVRIPPARKRITFAYTGLSLADKSRIRFRYRLETLDRGWSEPIAVREAAYTNLPPGNYRFRLLASNSDGTWNSSENVITFEVEPAYWQTW
jgi:hypothetical protein